MEGHMEIPSLSSSSPPFPTSPPSIYVSLSRPGSHPATHIGLELMAILLSQHPDINHYFQLLLFNCWNKTNPTPSQTPCPCSLEHYLTTWFSGAQATVQWNRSTLWKFHSGSGYADGRTTVKSHRDKAPGFLDPFWNQEGQATHQQSRKPRDIPLITSAEHKTGRCQENHETVSISEPNSRPISQRCGETTLPSASCTLGDCPAQLYPLPSQALTRHLGIIKRLTPYPYT